MSLTHQGHVRTLRRYPRTLMAVDAAVMVVDSAKGIEAQTKKLFEVVKHRDSSLYLYEQAGPRRS